MLHYTNKDYSRKSKIQNQLSDKLMLNLLCKVSGISGMVLGFLIAVYCGFWAVVDFAILNEANSRVRQEALNSRDLTK